MVSAYVDRQVNWIWGRSDRAGVLANLRRAVNLTPGDAVSTWGIEFGTFPEKLLGQGDRPSKAESAVHAALTLYAIHQQSHHSTPMHHPGRSLAAAVRVLALQLSPDNRVPEQPPHRFTALATAGSQAELLNHARGLIRQLGTSKPPIPLDYGQLAADLYSIQYSSSAPGVRLRWAREFAFTPPAATSDHQDQRTDQPNGGK
ncbi:MAG: type I-E CRISPR-associated protein Cse2/CasB [Bifidobacteriaceae bacterium]|jgi:CRISPR system Cascade subunit CasB|nr:type I-E CRISPR-associated protein Cse2/CasB [Bifidobacteriaceae bacterium]